MAVVHSPGCVRHVAGFGFGAWFGTWGVHSFVCLHRLFSVTDCLFVACAAILVRQTVITFQQPSLRGWEGGVWGVACPIRYYSIHSLAGHLRYANQFAVQHVDAAFP